MPSSFACASSMACLRVQWKSFLFCSSCSITSRDRSCFLDELRPSRSTTLFAAEPCRKVAVAGAGLASSFTHSPAASSVEVLSTLMTESLAFSSFLRLAFTAAVRLPTFLGTATSWVLITLPSLSNSCTTCLCVSSRSTWSRIWLKLTPFLPFFFLRIANIAFMSAMVPVERALPPPPPRPLHSPPRCAAVDHRPRREQSG
mmetsp:Transcript_24593/g.78542  ORF Transcript_24593/g.78542 Transcript_24593/m.78542 type:complete len:201 (-) Transcript_24593:19-621(-)